jgi:hypothetical protein
MHGRQGGGKIEREESDAIDPAATADPRPGLHGGGTGRRYPRRPWSEHSFRTSGCVEPTPPLPGRSTSPRSANRPRDSCARAGGHPRRRHRPATGVPAGATIAGPQQAAVDPRRIGRTGARWWCSRVFDRPPVFAARAISTAAERRGTATALGAVTRPKGRGCAASHIAPP